MSNVLNFPPHAQMETIDEPFFEQFADAALLLKCYEIIRGALDVICEPESTIEMEDDTHIDLIEALYAVKVMFKRRTGHDAKQVAQAHWEAASKHLLEGGPEPDQYIPVVEFPGEPLPTEAFDHLTDQQLACAAFNYSDRVRAAIMTNSLQALAMDEARVFSIDATTALRQLVLRLSGGSIGSMADGLGRGPGETLQ